MLYGFQPFAGPPEGLVDGRAVGVEPHFGGPPNFGQRAPGQVRGQATAQTHQGPLNLGERWALALPPRGGTAAAVSSGNDGSAPIIAPGREGSQLSAPLPKLVSTQTANGGGEGQPLAA